MKHLRTAFFSILLLNLVFFAWAQGYFGVADSNREPLRLANQLAAESLRITNTQVMTPAPAAPEAKPVQAGATPSTPPAQTAPPSADTSSVVPEKKEPPLSCRRISGASEEQVKHLQAALTAKLPGTKSSLQSMGGSASYWVHLPASANRAAADKKGAELRQLGVTDFHIMSEDSPNKNAISLGLFRSEQAARDLLANLGKKGVKSARIEVRGSPSVQQLEVRGTAAQMERLPELMKKTPEASLTDCAQ